MLQEVVKEQQPGALWVGHGGGVRSAKCFSRKSAETPNREWGVVRDVFVSPRLN